VSTSTCSRLRASLVLCAAALLLVLPTSAFAGSGGVGAEGAEESVPAPPPVAGEKARLLKSGLAAAPASAPQEVIDAIEAANRIDDTSYCTGGGHGKWNSQCYDCSGAVSYVLGPKGAGILKSPLPSGDFRTWGERGRGSWITVHYNAGHAYVVIAGLRFDTSLPDDGADGPGWSKDVKRGDVNGPFKKRHYLGL
jgi:hypothetical protein